MNPSHHYQQAQRFFEQGKLQEAVTLCREIIEAQPEFAGAYDLLGLLYRRTGNFEKALAMSDLALKFSPASGGFYLHKALHAMGAGRYELSIECLHKSLQYNPHAFLALLLLGDCYAQTGQLLLARQYFARARAINDTAEVDEHEGLGLHMLGEKQEARIRFEALIKRRPEYFGGYTYLAKLCVEQQQWQEAEQWAQKAVTLHPQAYEAWTVLGMTAFEKKDIAALHSAVRCAVDANPRFIPTYINFSNIFYRMGEFSAAEKLLLQALATSPDHLDALEKLAHVMVRLGKTEAALGYFRQIVDKQPDNHRIIHLCHALEGVHTETAPHQYVSQLFDGCAQDFEQHLQQKLGYSIPQILAQKFHLLYEASDLSLLDIGCGTGLVAEAFAPYTRRRIGVDLSPKMLAQARKKYVYDELHVAEAVTFLTTCAERFELIVAADVLVYIGNLEPLFRAVSARLQSGRIFAFSVESDETIASYHLRKTGRYAHSQAYIKSLAPLCGMQVELFEPTIIRKEANDDVYGYIAFFSTIQ